MKLSLLLTFCIILQTGWMFASASTVANAPPRTTRPNVVVVPEESDAPTVEELVRYTLRMSSLVYTFTDLRKNILKNRKRFQFFRKPVDREDLIMTQEGPDDPKMTADEKAAFRFRHLKRDISAADVKKFIQLNRKFVHSITMKGTEEKVRPEIDPIEEALEKTQDDIVIKEFDDSFSKGWLQGQLVYAICVNKTKRRIVVTFRGSVLGGKDWQTNILIRPINTLKDANTIKIHRGFYGYLNDHIDKATGKKRRLLRSNTTTKYDRIVTNLKHILEQPEYNDYDVIVSGHSLGGALAQFLSFKLAHEDSLKDYKNSKPITAITFASPKVGNLAFRKAYRQLEDQGKLRHIRVSNAGDVVPVIDIFGTYTQTGVNLHVSDNADVDVNYGERAHETFREARKYVAKQNCPRPLTFGCRFGKNALSYHNLDDHYEKLFTPNNRDVLDLTVEELYQKYR